MGGRPAQDLAAGLRGNQQDLLGAECLLQTESDWWIYSERPVRDRKWRHLSAQRYNGDHIAVTLGSLYRHPPPTSPPPSPSDSPSALIVSGEMLLCSGQQQHHNQTHRLRDPATVCRFMASVSVCSHSVQQKLLEDHTHVWRCCACGGRC